jgi:L-fuculose-phosphate aldolase
MATFVNEFSLRKQLCEIGNKIWQKGFCAGNEGNHSYRINDKRILCTPTGISKGFLKPDDICVVDIDGKQVEGKRKRTSEFLMHAAIYKLRPDVKAVIHSHPPHATAFAVAGVELPTHIHPEAEVFLGPVHTAKYVTPGDTRLGETIAPYVKNSNTVLMGNHGVVCFHADLEQCYYQLEIVDAYARILLLTKGLGSVKTLSEQEMSELIQLKAKFGLNDPRMEEAKKGAVLPVSTDFLARVGGDVARRGMMSTQSGGTAPAPQQAGQPSGLEAAIASMAPANFGEQDVEQLVQVITDQIMAAAT